MVNLFERLAKERPPAEQPGKQPAATTLVYQRGAERGFTKKQIWDAREKMKIVAFKETGKHGGRWFLTLPQHAGHPGTAGNT